LGSASWTDLVRNYRQYDTQQIAATALAVLPQASAAATATATTTTTATTTQPATAATGKSSKGPVRRKR
jgi:hypothetical protein